MTLHRWEKDVETVKGTGDIRKRGELIGRASYDLSIDTEGITAKSFDDNKARFTRRTVIGDLSLLDSVVLTGTKHSGSFILVLEDGREVDFYIESSAIKPGPTRQECKIQGSGNRF